MLQDAGFGGAPRPSAGLQTAEVWEINSPMSPVFSYFHLKRSMLFQGDGRLTSPNRNLYFLGFSSGHRHLAKCIAKMPAGGRKKKKKFERKTVKCQSV